MQIAPLNLHRQISGGQATLAASAGSLQVQVHLPSFRLLWGRSGFQVAATAALPIMAEISLVDLYTLLLSCQVVSNSLQPHGLQHPSLHCSSLSPVVCSNLCSLSRWCHPNISSSVASFSSCPQSFPVSGSFTICQLFTSGGWSIGASASALPMRIQGWFPLGLTGLISLLSKGLLRVFFSTRIWKHQFFGTQPSLWSNSHICTQLLDKP